MGASDPLARNPDKCQQAENLETYRAEARLAEQAGSLDRAARFARKAGDEPFARAIGRGLSPYSSSAHAKTAREEHALDQSRKAAREKKEAEEEASSRAYVERVLADYAKPEPRFSLPDRRARAWCAPGPCAAAGMPMAPNHCLAVIDLAVLRRQRGSHGKRPLNHFFYGILMDRDILAGVAGRTIPRSRLTKAWIEGFRRVCVKGESYPLLVPMAGGRVDGVLVRAITAREANRIAGFESGYVAEPLIVTLETGESEQAFVFLHGDLSRAGEREWDFDKWRRRHKRRYLIMASSN